MILIQPDYYTEFKCAASDCSDNCCIGWEIDIDSDTDSYYKNVSGKFGKRLQREISYDGTPHFILDDERCPFLNSHNLCDVIINLGEDKLCDICTEHPRFHEWFDNITESGLGISCEAAGQLVFKSAAPARFNTTENSAPSNEDLEIIDSPIFKASVIAREQLYKIVQNRRYSIKQRAAAMLVYADHMQACIDAEKISDINTIAVKYPDSTGDQIDSTKHLGELLSFFETLEPINPAWPSYLNSIKSNLGSILSCVDEFSAFYKNRVYEYEHLLVYFIYRYSLKSVFDGDILSRIKLAAVSLIIISLTDIELFGKNKQFTFDDRVQNAKAFSKEIEYSFENIQTLREESYMSASFATDSIVDLFLN